MDLPVCRLHVVPEKHNPRRTHEKREVYGLKAAITPEIDFRRVFAQHVTMLAGAAPRAVARRMFALRPALALELYRRILPPPFIIASIQKIRP